MKSALLSKIAMCVCPPAIVATSAVTVPPIKRAVHRATAPSAMPAAPKARPRRAFTAAYDCTPGSQGAPVQRLTDAAPIPTDVGDITTTGLPNQTRPVLFTGPNSFPGSSTLLPVAPPTEIGLNTPSPLPEASTWAMTIGGFAAVGIALRRRPAGKPQPGEAPDPA